MDGVGEWGDDPFEEVGHAMDSAGSDDEQPRPAARKREAPEPAVPTKAPKRARATSSPQDVRTALEYPLQGDIDLETPLQLVKELSFEKRVWLV